MTTPRALLVRRGLELLAFAAVPAVFVAVSAYVALGHGPQTSDVGAFWKAGRAVLHGRSPYVSPSSLPRVPNPATFAPFVYPAPAAVAVAPLGFLPFLPAAAVWLVVSLVAVAGALRLLGVRDLRCYGAAFASLPMASSLTLGTFSPLLLLGVAAAWRFRDRAVAAGLAVAAVGVAKVFLWPVGVWLLLTRRLRAGALAASVAVAVTLGAWAAIGFAGLREYPQLLARLTKLVGVNSYSLYALGVPQIACFALAGALLVAVRRRADATVLVAALAAALVSTPILWAHYLLLLFVPIALARPRFSVAWLLPSVLWLNPAPWSYGHPARIAFDALVAAAVFAVYARSVSSTSSAWVSGFTLRITRFTLPSASITKVERSTPM